MYWLTASGFSLGQILLLKVPPARAALNIPELIKHPSQEQKKEEGGLITTVKESKYMLYTDIIASYPAIPKAKKKSVTRLHLLSSCV